MPFVLVMGALCVSLYKDLQADPMVVRDRLGAEAVESAVVTGVEEHQGQFALVVEKAESGEPIRIEELPPTDPVVDPEGPTGRVTSGHSCSASVSPSSAFLRRRSISPRATTSAITMGTQYFVLPVSQLGRSMSGQGMSSRPIQ